MIKLLGSIPSPFVRKVRIVLAEKKLPHEFEFADVMSLTSTLYAAQPLGKIPCLLLDDGKALYDSTVIVDYLDGLGAEVPLLPAEHRARADVKCWEALADGVLDAGILVRWEATQRSPDKQDPAWVERQTRKIASGLLAMEAQLDNATWCHGDRLSLADIAVGACLGWLLFRFPDMGWQQRHPGLAALYARLAQRPSFSQTVPVAT